MPSLARAQTGTRGMDARRPGVLRLWPYAPYLVVVIAHLVELALPLDLPSFATKVLLMPALLVALVLTTRRPVAASTALLGAGVIASWAGDVLFASPDDGGFVAGLASFLVAHVLYAIALLGPVGARPRPWAVAIGAVWIGALLAVLLPHTGALAAPVVVYALALGTMAVVATGASRLVGAGGALFLASDSVLACTLFLPDVGFPGQDADIMALYCAAQLLLVAGVPQRAVRERADSLTA